MTAFVANTNVLELNGLQNSITEAYVNDATVTVTIVDANDDEVSGITWPATMAYVGSSDGDYRVTLAYALSLADGARYTAKITAVDGTNRGYWEYPFYAQTRTDA